VLAALLKAQPALPVVMFTAYASIATAVEAMRRGACDFIPKPFTPEQVRAVLAPIGQTRNLQRKVRALETQLADEVPVVDLDSPEPGMQRALEIAFKAAATPATMLILGPSGTGKSVLAREVHRRSERRDAPLVTVNCPSLSRELLESELFGHVKGAFTGAIADTTGKVAAADGGTLCLDEIGELPLPIQPKLLRLLQEREYKRVGETKPRRADVRVIAATNRNPAAAASFPS
jgi:NtrC-family two-component system response regulator AlgB